jgi:hypothetical protein
MLGACASDHPANEPEPDFTSCDVNSDCIVRSESCCGSCGAATRSDALAINKAQAAQYADMACDGDKGCPACAPLFIDPTLTATCRKGRCELVDLQKDAVTRCNSDDDCKIRTPDCCECHGDSAPGRLLGIASTAERDYAALVCDDAQACPECAAIYPPDVEVSCNAARHCATHDGRLPIAP